MVRLQSELVSLCQAAVDKKLDTVNASWDPRTSIGIVMAAGGYPGSYEKDKVIQGLDKSIPDVEVFHAGTTLKGDQVLTSGGRVLCVTALGDTVSSAQQKAYNRVKQISWDGVFYRGDIGYRAIAREQH